VNPTPASDSIARIGAGCHETPHSRTYRSSRRRSVGLMGVGQASASVLEPKADLGSNVYPGDIYVSSAQADVSGTALASDLGACTGAPTGVLSTFQSVPVSCASGSGNQAESPYITGGPGVDTIPAVEFTTVS